MNENRAILDAISHAATAGLVRSYLKRRSGCSALERALAHFAEEESQASSRSLELALSEARPLRGA